MLFPASSQPLPSRQRDSLLASLKTLDGLTSAEKLEVASRQLVAVLRVMAHEMDASQQGSAFTHICEGVEEWLEKEIDILHFLQGAGLA